MFLRNSGMHIIYELRILADNRLSWLMHAMPTMGILRHSVDRRGGSLPSGSFVCAAAALCVNSRWARH